MCTYICICNYKYVYMYVFVYVCAHVHICDQTCVLKPFKWIVNMYYII